MKYIKKGAEEFIDRIGQGQINAERCETNQGRLSSIQPEPHACYHYAK